MQGALTFKQLDHYGEPSADWFQAKRDPEEEGDFMAFEQLMAEAAVKKDKKEAKKEEKAKDSKVTNKEEVSKHHSHGFHHSHQKGAPS